jgi:hypothetical protein
MTLWKTLLQFIGYYNLKGFNNKQQHTLLHMEEIKFTMFTNLKYTTIKLILKEQGWKVVLT